MITVKTKFQRVLNLDIYVGIMSTNSAFEVPLVQDDTGPKLQFKVQDNAGTPIAVSGMGVNFYLRGTFDKANGNRGHEACSSVDFSQGLWAYTLQEGDVSAVGTYFGDIEVGYPDGTVETAYEAIRFLVRSHNKS